MSSHINDIDNMQFYKVPFSSVGSLVKKRKVFIREGAAFVPEGEIVFLFVPYFKKILLSGFEVSIMIKHLSSFIQTYRCDYHYFLSYCYSSISF